MVTSKPRLPTYTRDLVIDGLPVRLSVNPRCASCQKVVANYVAHPYSLQCPRCGTLNQTAVPVWAGSAVRRAATGDAAFGEKE